MWLSIQTSVSTTILSMKVTCLSLSQLLTVHYVTIHPDLLTVHYVTIHPDLLTVHYVTIHPDLLTVHYVTIHPDTFTSFLISDLSQKQEPLDNELFLPQAQHTELLPLIVLWLMDMVMGKVEFLKLIFSELRTNNGKTISPTCVCTHGCRVGEFGFVCVCVCDYLYWVCVYYNYVHVYVTWHHFFYFRCVIYTIVYLLVLHVCSYQILVMYTCTDLLKLLQLHVNSYVI